RMANFESSDISTTSPGSSSSGTSTTNQRKSISKKDVEFQQAKVNGHDSNSNTESRENIDILKSNRSNTKAASQNSHNDDGRKRRRRTKTRTDDTSCPVCGITIREGEMQSHLRNELERLTKLPQLRPLSQRSIILSDGDIPSTSKSPPQNPHLITNARAKDPGWDTFQKILLNRRKRMRAQRLRGHNGDDTREDTSPACPVCGETLSEASPDSITDHVEECLRKNEEEEENELLDIDVEDCDDADVEEYEWCGQTRVRATSMLRAEGQLHALGTKVQHCEEDVDVDIEDDEEELPYGKSQYGTEDLPRPPPSSSSSDGEEDSTQHSHNIEEPKENVSNSDVKISNGLASTGEAVIEALRERIRELESENDFGRFTCLVCHGLYDSPLVSVVCWHVHCEQCWLHSLAAKKLCPQCSAIVSPADLRKIYI
ncbi:unnamed protein product, partial [Meganyctiphanes norvegica]